MVVDRAYRNCMERMIELEFMKAEVSAIAIFKIKK